MAHLQVFVETNRFRPHVALQGAQFPVATADTGMLIVAAYCTLAFVWKPGFLYKKAGVILLDLVRAADVQAGLFDATRSPMLPPAGGRAGTPRRT